MATLVLGAVGSAIGGALIPGGLSLFGTAITGAAIGGAVGSIAGGFVDQALLGPLAGSSGQTHIAQGPRLFDLKLGASSEELTAQLTALDEDLVELDESLARSARLLDSYRADAAEALELAEESVADLNRDVAVLRFLTVVLALAIAVGQIAPFHIGRQLARGEPDPA